MNILFQRQLLPSPIEKLDVKNDVKKEVKNGVKNDVKNYAKNYVKNWDIFYVIFYVVFYVIFDVVFYVKFFNREMQFNIILFFKCKNKLQKKALKEPEKLKLCVDKKIKEQRIQNLNKRITESDGLSVELFQSSSDDIRNNP